MSEKKHDLFALFEGLGNGLTFLFIKPGIDSYLYKIIKDKGLKTAVHQYRKLRDKNSDDFNFSENKLNVLGYKFLAEKRIKEAIEILKLNVESYPDSFNVYDSLGEAYMINGDKDLALKNYRKSYNLNSDNTNTRNMIKKLLGE